MRSAGLVWWIAFAGLLVIYSNAVWLTLPRPGRRYLSKAAGARLAIGVVELVLVAAAIYLDRESGTSLRIAQLPEGGSTPPLLRVMEMAGSLISLSGAFLASWAKVRLGPYFTGYLGVKEGHRLVTEGPYGIVRHPIYLGLLLFILGSGLVYNSIPLLVLTLAILPCLLLQLRIEERAFATHFGREFEEYRRRVPMLLPWSRRSP
jgi:protein-S-isoprenylcysteine O-methyltransferase Ste14